jgi:UDP:flavonoid glycosyltransferase YjiC (YdhE family)
MPAPTIQSIAENNRTVREGGNSIQESDSAGSASRKRVLFIPASIRSHVLPALYLADMLSNGFDVYFAVTSQLLANIVSQNGYTPVMNSPYRIGVGMEQGYLTSKQKKAGFIQVLGAMYRNELYKHRKQELEALMARLQPEVVIIDIFNSTDLLPLYKYRFQTKIVFYNPMLSTYRVGKFPIVSEAAWPKEVPVDTKQNVFNLKTFIRNPQGSLYGIAARFQMKKLLQLTGLQKNHKLIETPFVRAFQNIPEIVLAPLQFELSADVKKDYQYYLGLCIREKRKDTELDNEFEQQWPFVLAGKEKGYRIIYCSFGTFYEGSDKVLLDFVSNLLEVIPQIPHVQLVCSVNGLVIETLKVRYTARQNVYFFKRVPQLEVLKAADVHITHGGLGSMKESIFYKVPMLVYPLDLRYDQNGNGLKVEHHGLGLRGVFGRERAADMRDKITKLLNDDTFRTNISQFQKVCTAPYGAQKIQDILTELSTIQEV